MSKGGMMLGVIGTSDKTPLTIGTGNREMHPILLSLTNVDPGIHTLQEFHTGKSSIYNAGGRLGKLRSINHWRIPKLELMNTVHENVIWMGAPYQ